MAFGKNNSKRKPTKGFSELNRRTYEASPQATGQYRNDNFVAGFNNQQNSSTPSNQSPRNINSNVSANSQSAYNNNPNINTNNQTPRGVNPSFTSNTQPPRRNTNRMADSFNPALNPNAPVDTQGYSRGDMKGRYNEHLRQAKAKRKKKIIIATVVIALIAIFAGAGIAIANIMGNMNKGMDDIGLTPTQYADAPFYMVLMGVDSSDERKSNGGTDNDYRSDSIILTRIDPVEKKVSMISLHRDVEVDMGEYGTQKLNAAHSLGGPELVIKTVSKLAGVPINHYAEINFDGFVKAVDDLGGVEVEVPMEIDDYLAGGYVPAGKQVLNGERALVLCRARHAYDDYGDGDKFRAANQRLVLSSIASKVLSSDIVTIAKTVTDLSQYIKTDMKLNDIIGLAQLMKDIDPKTSVYSAMMPTTPEYKNGGWYEILDETKWKEMMKRMDAGEPPALETVIDDSTGTVLSYSGNGGSSNGEAKMTGTVAVRNGTTTEGKAAKVSGKLTSLGFTTDVGNASTQDYSNTVIVYTNDSQKATAEAIREAIGCGKVQQNNNEYLYNTDFLVVVGSDYSD